VLLHIGTFFVIFIVFRQDITKILGALIHLNFKTENGKLALLIIVGSIPTATIGFVFKDLFESFFNNLLVVGAAFIITGCYLFLSGRTKDDQAINYLDAILIGTAQGIAIIPGISRSGATITTALLRKLGKETAYKFSFLVSIPAVIGATIVTASESKNLVSDVGASNLLLGLIVTVFVGYVSIRLLRKIMLEGKFHLFACYCWTAGLFVILAQILTKI